MMGYKFPNRGQARSALSAAENEIRSIYRDAGYVVTGNGRIFYKNAASRQDSDTVYVERFSEVFDLVGGGYAIQSFRRVFPEDYPRLEGRAGVDAPQEYEVSFPEQADQ